MFGTLGGVMKIYILLFLFGMVSACGSEPKQVKKAQCECVCTQEGDCANCDDCQECDGCEDCECSNCEPKDPNSPRKEPEGGCDSGACPPPPKG